MKSKEREYQPSIDIITNKDLNLSVEEFVEGLFREAPKKIHPRATGNISGEEYYPEMYRLR